MEKTDIRVHEFALFKQDPHMVHGIFPRQGGPLAGSIDLRNPADSGDEPLAREVCRDLVVKKMGKKPLVFLNQVHGDQIRVWTKNDLNNLMEAGKRVYTADAVITDVKGVVLVILVADCQAVMLYDPQKKIIANVHSGWRGSINNIIGKCVDKMILAFGCQPEQLLAGISPSLGPCCSEFVNYKDEIPEKLWTYKIKDKPYFDFWKMSADQLMDKGVRKEHIENMKICTKCHPQEFYSFRGENTTDRFACVISMA
ncbi:peptidoglycan editing factor PgeF [Desulfobacula sp.]|uniref:peptidoglycan editing factor PgeF n=1 Tax=Desulfobacula sp. TaxID=2593537 RepID=UPI002639C623|nr:peptidoglycan editing factor PgeF [Desulfobacula sp.]